MQVGDLIKNRYGAMGIITKQMKNPRHVWVQWCRMCYDISDRLFARARYKRSLIIS